MIAEGKFGTNEAVWFITIAIVAKVFYTSPAIVTGLVGTAGWYMTLISASVAVIGFTFIYLLLRRFPDKGLVEIYEIALGRIGGFVFSSMLAILLIYIAAIRTREFSEVLKVYILPLTPLTYILILFLGTVALLNLLGLETLARLSKLTGYTMVAGFIIVILLGQQNYSFYRLFPILGYGIGKTLYNGIIRSSVYGEVICLAVFAPSLQGIKHIKKVGYTSLAFSGAFISLALLAFIMTFPYYAAIEVTSPMYEMITLIDYGRFLQRVDPIFVFIMGISSLLSVSAVVCAFISIYCKMFRIQDNKPVILPTGIIVYTMAIASKSMSQITFGNVQALRDYGSIFFYILPLIALIMAKLRKKGDA
ncbi:MAG: GerAB/ArcD/ProY family transporter [Pseudomonadota bacterium]